MKSFELQQQGNMTEAEKGFRHVLSLDPGNIHALNLLGINFLATDRADQAVAVLRKAAGKVPGDPETRNSLGLALVRTGQADEAATQFTHALKMAGPNAELLGNLGGALVECGRANEALAPLTRALRMGPPTADLLANLAKALSTLGRYEEARPAAEQAARLQSDQPTIQNILGEILLKQGRLEEATNAFERSLELDTTQIDAGVNLATTHKESGNAARAQEILRELASTHPTSAVPHFDLGVLAEQMGEAEKALEHFQRAITLERDFAKAYYQASQLKGVALPNGLKSQIEALLSEAKLPETDQMLLHFALATILEKEGDYGAGIAHFKKAHASVRDTYDPATTERMHARQRAAFPAIDQKVSPSAAGSSPRPLFVLGMPRSGTSLVEQILSAHPQIEGAGESSFLTDCTNEAAKLVRTAFPECMTKLSPAQLADLGGSYRRRLFAGRTAASWVIDKTPLNFQLIGFARAILPEARFLHCRRDPLNTCLSIYKIPFDQNQNYAASYASLGHFYGAYRDLMEHWHTAIGEDLLALDYEALVDDVEGETRHVLDWLDLGYDPAVLEFHKQRRLVRTPSATQVNQPIYRGSLSLADKYGDALGELRDALSQA
ncbi:MAG: tetratricopeptide repeat-containing sulfotransferase family protein [Erythrobacter sp.]|uniref:tetratricopeptide repeat-containing sulfotransferase family protein n=1 Tax=Erythrobacter sp. TaxID=1042 RepID=UPI003A84956D